MKIVIVVDTLDTRSGWGRLAQEIGSGFEGKSHIVEFVAQSGPNCENVHVLKMRDFSLRNPVAMVRTVLGMRRLFKKNDVVLCLDVNPYGILSSLALLGLKKVFVLYAVGTYSLFTRNWWINVNMRRAYRAADRVFFVSEFVKRRIENSKFSVESAAIVPVGVNITHFLNQSELAQSTAMGDYLISVGPLKHRKGYHVSIRAFALLAGAYPALNYVIVGNKASGPYVDELLAYIEEQGLSERIIFRDDVTDSELVQLYSNARLFLLTPVSNTSNIEGFGMVYLEAGACGLPVVGTYDSGAEAAIENGVNGILVKAEAPAVASAVKLILDDSLLAKRLAIGGKGRAASFSWDRIIDAHLTHFNKLLNHDNI